MEIWDNARAEKILKDYFEKLDNLAFVDREQFNSIDFSAVDALIDDAFRKNDLDALISITNRVVKNIRALVWSTVKKDAPDDDWLEPESNGASSTTTHTTTTTTSIGGSRRCKSMNHFAFGNKPIRGIEYYGV